MSKKTHAQEAAEVAAHLDPTIRRPTPLNPNGFELWSRMPGISQRLLIVEKLLEAALDVGSGALPSSDASDEEWDDWYEGLRLIVADARAIAEDCYEQGAAE